jgi:hypothetical protein
MCLSFGCKAEAQPQEWPISLLQDIARVNAENGYAIDVLQVSGNERFMPTKGGPGAYVNVLEARPLLRGKANIRAGERIMLYPYTDAVRVIVLTMDGRNWVPYSENVEKILTDQIKRFRSR